MRFFKEYYCVFIVGILFLLSNVSFAQESDFEDKTTDELAKELANPNTPLTSLKFKNQFRTYTGSLAGSDAQGSYTMFFQSTLPFPFKNGETLWIRPSVPLIFGSPSYNNNSFDSNSGLGDIVIDFQYGGTTDKGLLWSFGATGTIPTAIPNELGFQTWILGPGFQVGYISKKYIVGAFLNHQWSIGGSNDISLSTLQVFNVFLPAGGWSVASGPIMTYSHINDNWDVPLNFAASKTVKINGRPWKFGLELNYYVSDANKFGPKWMIAINIAPVVKNVIANWF